jgi:hypothetical protein
MQERNQGCLTMGLECGERACSSLWVILVAIATVTTHNNVDVRNVSTKGCDITGSIGQETVRRWLR